MESAPEPWSRLIVIAVVEEDWAKFTTHSVAPDGTKGSFRLRDSLHLAELFRRVRQVTETVGRGRWTSATFTLQATGEFDVDFQYE